jgi:hypothetical protein
LKTALDLNWDDPRERQNALSIILNSLNSVEEWMQSQSESDEFEVAQSTLVIAGVIEFQNVTLDSQGVPMLSKGVVKDRRISIEDPDMRHGRKSSSQKINGYNASQRFRYGRNSGCGFDESEYSRICCYS